MKRILQILTVAALVALAAPLSQAETVVALPSPASLQGGGGVLTIDVDVLYAGTPAAMGLDLTLPTGWILESVSGDSAPQIVPPAGTTERVECAWTSSPAGGAKLTIKLAYPPHATTTHLSGAVLLRREGKARELEIRIPLGS